jgi:hypothetical protein
MTNFNDFLAEQLENPELKAEYDALEPEFSMIQAAILASDPLLKEGGICEANDG